MLTPSDDLVKTWLPLVLSTATALYAIWVGQRGRRQDARRAFVEFAIKQRTDVAVELLAAMTQRVQLIDEAAGWRKIAVDSTDPATQAMGKEKMLRILRDPIEGNTTRMNDAWAAAHTVLSGDTLNAGEDLVRVTNEAALDPAKFDKARVTAALVKLSDALRSELRVAEVLTYQGELFSESWLARRRKKGTSG